ncbi:YybH family protein [Maricaulis sp. CAU 1757]
MIRLISAGTLALFASSQAVAQDTPEALLQAFVAAVAAEDSQALASLYTEDADSYSPGTHHVRGPAAIGADWQGFFDAYDDISLDIETHGSAHFGDNHAAWGVWTLSQTPAGGGEEFSITGRFMDVQQLIDGRWYYVADHASVSPETAASE